MKRFLICLSLCGLPLVAVGCGEEEETAVLPEPTAEEEEARMEYEEAQMEEELNNPENR